jgi:hypothetical protein
MFAIQDTSSCRPACTQADFTLVQPHVTPVALKARGVALTLSGATINNE